jgi:hypothetical protein
MRSVASNERVVGEIRKVRTDVWGWDGMGWDGMDANEKNS